MNLPEQLKTPTKTRPIPITDDLRFIVSEEKPKTFGIIDEFIHDTFENHLLFLSKQKPQQSEEQPIYQYYLNHNSDQSSPSHDSQQQQKFQTVKKQFERKFVPKHDQHLATARQNHKGCNCDRSKCQKNYCLCFKMGKICSQDCQCIGCENHVHTISHEKNQKIANEIMSNSKLKGCNCKHTNCLKNYCICHQNGNKCSDACKCQNCHNMDDKGSQSREEENGGMRLMFTARKRVKVSEFDYEENKENINVNY